MPQKRNFTMQRSDRMERSVVAADGRTHVMDGQRRGRDGHFTDEGAFCPLNWG